MEQPGTDMTKKETKMVKKEVFLKAFRSNLFNVTQACLSVPIGRTTYYRWYDEDESFREKVEICKEEMIDMAESALLRKIEKGDTISIIFFLKTIGKYRGYIENPTINVKSAISQMSEERRQAAIDAAMMELPPIHVIQIENNTGNSEDME
jgi:hypothetical protein